jgi:ABC-2 type transport system ATP-binding protein
VLFRSLIRPTAGSATVLGLDAQARSREVRRRVGNLPGEFSLWPRLRGWDTLEFIGRLRGEFPRTHAGELAERLDLDLTRIVGDLSHGNKQKVGLIQAMMGAPELLILDEPTTGLDPLVQQTFQRLLAEGRAAGQTVLLSSHVLTEVERVCDRVGILRAGRLQGVEEVGALRKAATRWITLHFAEPVDEAAFAALAVVSELTSSDGTLRMRVSGAVDPVLKTAARWRVLDIESQEPSLEEVFLEYYGDDA